MDRYAVSRLHDDMKARLEDAASLAGFCDDYKNKFKIEGGKDPDVCRINARTNMLFVGDAKVSENETPSCQATCDRLLTYFQTFHRVLAFKLVNGGTLAVLTDDGQIAQDWVPKLNELAKAAGFAGDRNSVPNFVVSALATYWCVAW